MHAATNALLVQLLTTAGLIGATIEYAEIIKRRAQLRLQAAERAWFEEDGLRGLVRVFEASDVLVKAPRRRWRQFAIDHRRRRAVHR
jgi:hypothetical protein